MIGWFYKPLGKSFYWVRNEQISIHGEYNERERQYVRIIVKTISK